VFYWSLRTTNRKRIQWIRCTTSCVQQIHDDNSQQWTTGNTERVGALAVLPDGRDVVATDSLQQGLAESFCVLAVLARGVVVVVVVVVVAGLGGELLCPRGTGTRCSSGSGSGSSSMGRRRASVSSRHWHEV